MPAAVVLSLFLACSEADGARPSPAGGARSATGAPSSAGPTVARLDAPDPLDPGPGAEPQPLASEAAVPPSTLAPPAEFWTLGDAGCPAGGRLTPPTPGPGATTTWCSGPEGTPTPYASLRDGRPTDVGLLLSGECEGVWRRYRPDGSLVSEESYHLGKLHGVSRTWSEGGVLLSESGHRAGRAWGEWVTWNASGQELSRSTLVNGTGALRIRTAAGTTTTPYVFGLAHGEAHAEDTQGRPVSVVHYAAGEKHGLEQQWYDGVLTAERTWRRGERHGAEATWVKGEPHTRARWFLGREVARTLMRDGAPIGQLPAPNACDDDAYASAVGLGREQGDARNLCVLREPLLPGAVQVGTFAYDRGCRAAAWAVGCERAEAAPSPTEALRTAGWVAATPAQREQLATAAVDLYLLGFSAQREGAPTFAHGADGSVALSGTARGESGMRREAPAPTSWAVRITADGTWTSTGG